MPGDQPGRQRGRLSLPLLLEVALALVDRDGVRALSMRALGRELGVEAMALYRYVPTFETLLDEIVEHVVDQVLDDPNMQPDPDEDWRSFLTRQAHGVRRIATTRPQVFPLIATRPPSAPWIRPPLRSLRWVEEFLSGLLVRGFAEDGAVAAYRAFTSFLLGHLLLEVSSRGADTSPVAQTDVEEPDEPVRDDLAPYPTVAHLAGQLGEDCADREFQAALACLLDRLEHLAALPPPGSSG